MVFRALVTDRDASGKISNTIQHLSESLLPEGEVLVSVEWAGFNYKDALCLKGLAGLVRNFPHIGGIDFAGRVIESSDRRYHPGQGVILTGWRVGELVWGGFAERARVKADWLVPLPKRLSTRVIGREAVITRSGKGLDSEQWAGAIDNVGGEMLGELLKKMSRNGAVAAVGNAGGVDWPGSVLPFILRGVSLFGIDSVMQPFEQRQAAWDRLASLFVATAYAGWVDEIDLTGLPAMAERILKGQVQGRVIVNPREAAK